MTPIGAVHTTFSFVAIAAGAAVLFTPKGTRWHRTLGHLYATNMVGIVVTAFALYTLTGRWGPFHFAAIAGGLTLAGGLYTVLARRPKKDWIAAHAIWMSWSYIGLMAAFASESLTRFVMPRVATFLEGNELWGAFWFAVAAASFSVVAVGYYFVKKRLPSVIAGTPQAMRLERQKLESRSAAGAAEASSA